MANPYVTAAELAAAKVGPHVDGDLLGLYLGDHLSGATGGRARIADMAKRYVMKPYGSDLALISEQVEREYLTMSDVVEALGFSKRPVKRALAWVGERVGSLKPNGRLVKTSPMTPVLELDLMRAAVNGKGAGWEVLEHYAGDLGLPSEPFARLATQSQEQAKLLSRAHAIETANAFRR